MQDAASARHILFVTPVSPFATKSGSEQRSHLMLSALNEVGAVDVLQLSQSDKTHLSAASEGCRKYVKVEINGRNFSLNRYQPQGDITKKIEFLLGRNIDEYDLVVGRYIWPICQIEIPASVPAVVDVDDFCYRFSSLAPFSFGSLKVRLSKAISEWFIKRELSRFNCLFFASSEDRKMVPNIKSVLLPNISTSKARHTSDPDGLNIIFVGSLWYRPNFEGINWFLKEVWPLILLQEPSSKFTIIGSASRKTLDRWKKFKNVNVPGFVENLDEYYKTAALVVVPILSGGGTNIKVIEAMEHSRPCVTTRFSHSAMSECVVAERDLLVADDASDFAQKCISVLKFPLKYKNMAQSGKNVAEQFFSPNVFRTTVINFAVEAMARSNDE